MMTVKLLGHLGSPYSRKIRSYLRYKQIRFEWIQTNTSEAMELPASKIPLIPAVYFDNENFGVGHTDSTPLIKLINDRYTERTTTPDDPVLAFLCELLEDFADEWLNKMMFYYRFRYNGIYNSRFLLLATNPSMDERELEEFAKMFENRQIRVLSKLICVDDKCCQFLEKEYLRTIKILDALLSQSSFLFGTRPSSADFAFFGQFSQLVITDPTPSKLASENGFRLRPWCELMEDLSGMDLSTKNWLERHILKTSKPQQDLLQEVNNIYLPMLNANFMAFKNGKNEFSVILKGVQWKQNINKYHVKCLHNLCNSYKSLTSEDKDFVKFLGINTVIFENISSRL